MTLTKDISKARKTRQKQKETLRKMIAKNSDIQYLIDIFELDFVENNSKRESANCK